MNHSFEPRPFGSRLIGLFLSVAMTSVAVLSSTPILPY